MAPLFANAKGWVGLSSTERSKGLGRKKAEWEGSDLLSQREEGYFPAGRHFPS